MKTVKRILSNLVLVVRREIFFMSIEKRVFEKIYKKI